MSDTFDPHALDDEMEQIDRGGDVAGWTPAHRDDGGPAFPRDGFETESGRVRGAQAGLSLRDYFAAKALPAVIGTTQSWKNLDFKPTNGLSNAENDALCAYQVADAMLKARAS